MHLAQLGILQLRHLSPPALGDRPFEQFLQKLCPEQVKQFSTSQLTQKSPIRVRLLLHSVHFPAAEHFLHLSTAQLLHVELPTAK